MLSEIVLAVIAACATIGVILITVVYAPGRGWLSYNQAYLVSLPPAVLGIAAAALAASKREPEIALVLWMTGLFFGVILLIGSFPNNRTVKPATELERLLNMQIYLFAVGVDDNSASKLIEWLTTQMHNGVRECLVVLNTDGGSLLNSGALYDWIRLNNSRLKVNLLVTGRCSSGGTTMLMSVPREQRYGTPLSQIMFHPATCTDDDNVSTRLGRAVQGDGVVPVLKDHLLTGYRWQEQVVVQVLAHGLGLSAEAVRGLMGPSDTWFDATKALEIGLIGTILPYPE